MEEIGGKKVQERNLVKYTYEILSYGKDPSRVIIGSSAVWIFLRVIVNNNNDSLKIFIQYLIIIMI